MKYFISVFLLLFLTIGLSGQTDPDSLNQAAPVNPVNVSTKPQGVPLTLDSSIYIYNGIGPYSLEKRAERIAEKLTGLKSGELDISQLEVVPGDLADDIVCGDVLIMSLNAADANALGLSRKGAAVYYTDLMIAFAESEDIAPMNVQSLLINAGIALVIVILFAFGLRYFNKLFRLFYHKIHAQKGKIFKGFSIKKYELLTEEKQVLFVVYAVKAVRIVLLVLIIYLLLPVLFSLFPWTQSIADTLFGYVLDPVKSIGAKAVAFIPNLLTIIVIWIVTKYLLKLLEFFKEEVARGRLELPGFYPEWAKPTFNIVKILIIALAFIGVWPLLPMSDSDIFKGVSTFIGLLVALGGAGAISNVIAGLVITYMRSFKIGDRVKIGDVMGDVKEKSLLNTRIKTIKNEIITIPNSQMLNSHTINYTTANDEQGLILHTTITLGYDVPWRTAHKVLIEAALATEFVKKLPKPYVLQTSLDDFYVSYQLNARTREIHKMALIYSEMHKNIQDKCNEAGIEILSPHYGAQRDGNHSTIPQEHLPEDYQAPWFRIKNT
ncbi:MAG: mechanosensitive ion channel family protein [Roseivirga sp.]|nr:mechanosensitive ion channel family protein [Roseivirga sp.]